MAENVFFSIPNGTYSTGGTLELVWKEFEEWVCSCDVPDIICFFHQHLDDAIHQAEIAGIKGFAAKLAAIEILARAEALQDVRDQTVCKKRKKR